ncbi:transducin family protein [Actinidia rufa]|uniref:Transducin family protein n=1 Tax=Actinidia rufa TaxID=165716 RepID=A0A7J0GC13_9ERIC|nr:transducin family protein [Actinidia rufa]
MSLNEDVIFLFLQFCHEEGLTKTAHMIEHETGAFFDMEYFEDLVLSGNWDEAEKYLSGFTRLDNDKYSIKIYFEIRKQKFLEALDEHDHKRALDILVKDLKAFAESNEELYKEMTRLLILDDFRKHESLSSYGDTLSARRLMMNELKNVMEADPLFQDKLKFPHMKQSRLRHLINQSLNWQHIRCTYPQPDPVIKTLFTDHQCPLPEHPHIQSCFSICVILRRVLIFCMAPFQATAPSVSPFSCEGSSTVTQSVISDGSVNPSPNPGSGFSYVEGAKDSSFTSETRSSGTLDEVESATTFPGQTHTAVFNNHDDFPMTVQRVLSEASSPTSMDFHPVQQNILSVGTNNGDIGLWELSSGERLLWSKIRMSQLIVYYGALRVHYSIDAHVGSVNDLAFSKSNELFFLITCGNDKFIQVWDAITGAKQYTFEGHGAPVYSLCPHVKKRIHFLFSTSFNGEIKAWLYDNMGSRIAFDTPGRCCTRMAYSADSKRLFSCGTAKDGESFIVEWDESEGCIKRSYKGLGKCSSGIVQFDSSKNRFLFAGDDHLIKVWDMNHSELLTTMDADGDLPMEDVRGLMVAFVQLAINPISTAASARGTEGVSVASSSIKNDDGGNQKDMKPELHARSNDILEVWKSEINEPSHSANP